MKTKKMNKLEEGSIFTPDFEKIFRITDCVIPVIVQNRKTKEVLLLAYTNKEALELSLKNDVVCFWSTSRKKIWLKGESSGDYLKLKEARINCEQNSLLYLVEPRTGSVCHTEENSKKRNTCFYRRLKLITNRKIILEGKSV